jgi:hypothetical protein
MQAIEFTSKSHDRMIPIPEHYNDWFKKPVKIILLAMEPSHEVNPQKTTDLNRFAGTISSPYEPSAFQTRQLSRFTPSRPTTFLRKNEARLSIRDCWYEKGAVL